MAVSHPLPPVDLVALAAAQASCLDCQQASSSSLLQVMKVLRTGWMGGFVFGRVVLIFSGHLLPANL
jgi:hypothetical protein